MSRLIPGPFWHDKSMYIKISWRTHYGHVQPFHWPYILSMVMLMPEHCGPQWLQKQAKARQVAEFQDSDLTEEERNPLFLRDKGK